jgi:hypothetical protein
VHRSFTSQLHKTTVPCLVDSHPPCRLLLFGAGDIGKESHSTSCGRVECLHSINITKSSKFHAISLFRHANSGRPHSMVTSCAARRLDQRKTTETINETKYKLLASKIVPKYTRNHQQNKFPSVSSKVTCRRSAKRIYRTQVIPWIWQRPSRFLITCLAKMAFDKEYWAPNHARVLSTSCATLSPFACRSSIVDLHSFLRGWPLFRHGCGRCRAARGS